MLTAVVMQDDRRTWKEVSQASGVSEGTLKLSYADLYPYREQLIPESFASPEKVRLLSATFKSR